MIDQNRNLKELLNIIIGKLSSPLTEEEKACGWRSGSKQGWLGSMQDFLEKLEKDEFNENQEKEINLTRELDFSGVLHGSLAEMIRQFGREWNNKYAKKPEWWDTNPKRRRSWPWS